MNDNNLESKMYWKY